MDTQLQGYVDTVFAKYDVDRSGFLDGREASLFFNDTLALSGQNKRLSQQ